MSRAGSRPRVTKREQGMRRFLAKCDGSGLSKAAFARKRKLNPGTFAWWSSEIRRRDAARRGRVPAPVASEPSFVDVVVRRDAPAPVFFEVELSADCLVRVPAGFAAEDLSRLLIVVEGRC
jgi:hypothetical protein